MSSIGSSAMSEMLTSSNHYFSLDDILASQERIPLSMKQDIPQLGFLDPQSHYQNDATVLATGTTLELPLWMAKDFKAKNRAKLELPKTWSLSQRDIVKADPSVVDLHKLGPYFYQSGCHILKYISVGQELDDEADKIGNILVDTLTKRFRGIMDASANAEAQDTLINTESLDSIERGLYRIGQQSRRLGDAWLLRTTGKIQTAAIVLKHRKLKRKADVLNS